MYREQEKQRQQARSQAREMKPSNYFAALAQSQQAADQSNQRYGFKLRAKASIR